MNIKLIVFYDNWCPKCTSFKKLISKLDWFNMILFVELRNGNEISKFPDIDINRSKKEMASFSKNIFYYGYDSIYLIFKRIPVLLIFIPLLFLIKITRIGHLIYREFAIKRKIIPLHCNEDSCDIKF